MASGRLIVPIAEPILTVAGVPASGATMTVYDTGTTNLATVCSDAGLTTPITNPLVANQAGRFYAQSTVWWLNSALAYDVVIALPDGTSITLDNLGTLAA